MRIETLGEGFVHRCEVTGHGSAAGGARLANTGDGEILCSFALSSGLGINDFVTTLARSADNGQTWSLQGPVWPALAEKYAIFCSISREPVGQLFLSGERTAIDTPGETFWSDATQGLKQNELVWSRSTDNGRTWAPPQAIPMPIPGSAEVPGALWVTRAGRWLVAYSPYNTFDPHVVVDRNQVVVVYSDNHGQTWHHTSMIRFPDQHSSAAEAWVVELANGHLLGTCWHMNQADGSDHPNAYAISLDGGTTWQPTQSTGIMGQSTSLTPLADGRTLFVYNQRRHGEVGVWMAVVQPTATDFGIQANQIIWRAQTATQSGSEGEHHQWTDFSFGEPHVAVLPDGTLLLVLWCNQPSGTGIRYARLKLIED